MGRRRLVATVLGTAVLATMVATAGCSAGSGGDSASVAEPAAPPGAVADGGAPEGQRDAAEPGEAGQPGSGAGADLRVDQRSIIYTGSVTVRVDNVGEAASRAVALATGAGGFVGSDKRSSDSSSAEATLQLRVPADRFASVVDALGKLGEPLRRDVSTQDVTEETVDLEARIATQQARVNSGRRLLAEAKTLNELILLEGELAKREADLASLEAKKRRLADLTALSTITVSLLGPEATLTSEEKPDSGFLAGLRTGWRGFLASLELLLTVAGVLLPWLIALGLPAWALLRLRRRLRRNNPPPPAYAAIPRPTHPPYPTQPPQQPPAQPVEREPAS